MRLKFTQASEPQGVNESIKSVFFGEEFSSGHESGTVTLSIAGTSTSVGAYDFYKSVCKWIVDKTEEHERDKMVFTEIIERLLDNRDFLCLQLDHAYGNIPDEEFEELSEPYLKEHRNLDHENLRQRVLALLKNIPRHFDAETISTVFDCSLEQAEQIIESIVVQQSL